MNEPVQRGLAVESAFGRLLRLRDPDARPASRSEQFSHVDWVSKFGTFDVKARKRATRASASFNDDWVWLEIDNVRGDRGWLRSDVKYLAFERVSDFVIFRREDVRQMAQALCSYNVVTEAKHAPYNLYSRAGRKDLLTVIRMGDMLGLDHRVWVKH